MNELFDVIIVGAGPAGCACAYMLRESDLKVAVIEKDEFPRDKICGDALSPDIMNQLNRIDPELRVEFDKLPKKKVSHGVRMFSPNYDQLDIKFNDSKATDCFVVKRMDFDNFLFESISRLKELSIYSNHEVEDIEVGKEEVLVKTTQGTFRCQMVIGADGAHSVLNKKLTDNKIDKRHYSAGLRQYYKNVGGFDDSQNIELHFYKGILPGYFWIFPMENNQANVGIGMRSHEIGNNRINLRKKLAEIIETHPNVKGRFENAVPLESAKGFGLPLGSKKRTCSGNRFLLLGDAASLIDPFTGEGIGMAIRSGRIAADHILKAFEVNRFDAEFNSTYDGKVYNKMWFELNISPLLQRLLNYPKLFSLLFKLARRSRPIQRMLIYILDNQDFRKYKLNPFGSKPSLQEN